MTSFIDIILIAVTTQLVLVSMPISMCDLNDKVKNHIIDTLENFFSCPSTWSDTVSPRVGGFYAIEDLLQLPYIKSLGASVAVIKRTVQDDPLSRFSIHGNLIRTKPLELNVNLFH